MPGAALGPGQQHEVPAEQVERGQPCAVAVEEDVRRPRARPARLTGVLVQRMAARLEDDGGGVVAVADLEGEVVDERWVFGPQVRGDPRGVARVGLVDDELAERPPLGVVGVEQRRPAWPRRTVRELPGEVVRVLKARVAAEAAVGRDDVRGVAGEEHAAGAEALGAVGLGPPVGDVDDLHRDVGADRGAQQLARALLGQARTGRRSPRAVVTSSPTVLITRKPLPPRSVEPEEAAQRAGCGRRSRPGCGRGSAPSSRRGSRS